MAELPFLLAGPILRRVDDRRVSVWFASAAPTSVTLRVFPGRRTSVGGGLVAPPVPPVAEGSAITTAFGAALHVCVVVADADPSRLSPGTLYSYDLQFQPSDPQFPDSDLRGLGLLEDEEAGTRLDGVDDSAPLHRALGYEPDMLPSFAMPPGTLAGLRLAHASCRKTNAEGPDALAFLDDQIGRNVSDPGLRPQQLFLTGDQVYGDDVGAVLLPMLAGLGKDLVAGVQRVTVDGTTIDGSIENLPAMRRAATVRIGARFTSTEAHNHLITYPEFAAMYLAAWSPRVWRPLATADDIFIAPGPALPHPAPDEDDPPLQTDWEAAHKDDKGAGDGLAKWRRAAEHELEEEAKRVALYRSAVPSVARVLANVPTFMIWDDHEVTDDWNISLQWRRRVLGTDLGPEIIRNATMAYAIFQAWGNDPQAFAAGNNAKVLEKTADAWSGVGPHTVTGATRTALDALFSLKEPPAPGATAADKAVWNYTIDGPIHRVAVLDSRTRRSFAGSVSPPDLLGSTLEAQVPKGPMADGRELLVLVSPSPVVDPQIFDRLATPLAEIFFETRGIWDEGHPDPAKPGGRLSGAESADLEGWPANEVATEKLLDRLSGHPRVVILAGDVHFGYSMVLDYWKKGQAQAVARIVNLTASAARNPWPPMVRAVLRRNAMLQRYERIPAERIAWKDASKVAVPAGVRISPGRRTRMGRSPSLLPTRGWPPGTTVTAEPDWRWRLSMLRDQRADADLPLSYPKPPALGSTAGGTVGLYGAVAARHAGAALSGIDHLRQIVFVSNVGLVDLEADGAGVRLRHTLLSETTPDSLIGAANTVHQTSFVPSTEAAPTLMTT